MKKVNTGGPAFPCDLTMYDKEVQVQMQGMTLREYAAIKLKVPNSGTDWLDEMIRQSRRDEFSAKAMQAILSDPNYASPDEKLDESAYYIAAAMLKSRGNHDRSI